MTDVMLAKRAIVTGVSGGIGSATAAALRAGGASVIGLDRAGTDDPDVIACDVTDGAQVERAVADAEVRLGGLDVVVNVVGISGRSLGDGPVHECSDEGWDRVMQVNLRSVFLVCRAAIPRLERGSSIINVTSVLGSTGDATGLFATHAYAASKGAIISLTRAMAATYAAEGIRVNAVAPGLVRTPMSGRAQTDDEVLRVAGARQPLTGPLIEPTAVASAVAFLASAAAEGITGVVLPVDGGWLTT